MNIAEIVGCSYDVAAHVINGNTAIVLQCGWGGYRNCYVAPAIADVDHYLKP